MTAETPAAGPRAEMASRCLFRVKWVFLLCHKIIARLGWPKPFTCVGSESKSSKSRSLNHVGGPQLKGTYPLNTYLCEIQASVDVPIVQRNCAAEEYRNGDISRARADAETCKIFNNSILTHPFPPTHHSFNFALSIPVSPFHFTLSLCLETAPLPLFLIPPALLSPHRPAAMLVVEALQGLPHPRCP
jgi:hypothetical protein